MGKIEKEMLVLFISEKENNLNKFTHYVGLDELSFEMEELKGIEEKAKEFIGDNTFADLYNIYIGEILLKNISGSYWEIGGVKKDLAYHKPIILNGINKNRMRICPIADWFGLLKNGRLQEGISGIVEKVIKYQNR